jgi:hypothetical protein
MIEFANKQDFLEVVRASELKLALRITGTKTEGFFHCLANASNVISN